MDAQLQQLIELHVEQNQLLRRYLWRFRFSLAVLLILTTVISCGLGFVIYTQQQKTVATPRPLPSPSSMLRFMLAPGPSTAVPANPGQ
jgi:hypothetical protein